MAFQMMTAWPGSAAVAPISSGRRSSGFPMAAPPVAAGAGRWGSNPPPTCPHEGGTGCPPTGHVATYQVRPEAVGGPCPLQRTSCLRLQPELGSVASEVSDAVPDVIRHAELAVRTRDA